MNESLRQLLVETRTEAGSTLFKNAADLGRKIAGLPESHYKDRESSAISFVTQVLRGAKGCKRILAVAILEAVKSQLANEGKLVQEQWAQRVNSAIKSQNQQLEKLRKEERQGLTDEELFDDILQKSREAAEQFIVTAMTAEQSQVPGKGGALRDILVERLGLYNDSKTQNKRRRQPDVRKEPATAYTFLLPQDATAIAFWKNLFRRIVMNSPIPGGNLAPHDAFKKLRDADAGGLLRVFVAEQSAICGCPIIVFDVEKSSASAYSFCFDENFRPRVVQWDSLSISLWRNNVYLSFDAIAKDRFSWDRVEKDPEIANFHVSYHKLSQ